MSFIVYILLNIIYIPIYIIYVNNIIYINKIKIIIYNSAIQNYNILKLLTIIINIFLPETEIQDSYMLKTK